MSAERHVREIQIIPQPARFFIPSLVPAADFPAPGCAVHEPDSGALYSFRFFVYFSFRLPIKIQNQFDLPPQLYQQALLVCRAVTKRDKGVSSNIPISLTTKRESTAIFLPTPLISTIELLITNLSQFHK